MYYYQIAHQYPQILWAILKCDFTLQINSMLDQMHAYCTYKIVFVCWKQTLKTPISSSGPIHCQLWTDWCHHVLFSQMIPEALVTNTGIYRLCLQTAGKINDWEIF